MLIKLDDWQTEAILVQSLADLPQWFNNEFLYLDVETTSGEDKLKSTNPWHNCKLLGVSIIVDSQKRPLYIPIRHRCPSVEYNMPLEPILKWLQKVIDGSKIWVNHNIKYDMHVLANEGLTFDNLEVIDTLSLCKLAPFGERFTYNLTDILREWLQITIQHYEDSIKISLGKANDYGLIPIDRMSAYSAVDVLAVRALYTFLLGCIPEECQRVVEVEKAVTPILYDIERNGMRADLERIAKDADHFPMKLEALSMFLSERLGMKHFYPHISSCCKDLFLTKLGMPVVEWTENDAPSFGSTALLTYKAKMPELAWDIDLMLEYKELYKLWSSFTKPYADLHVNGIIHPDYNQIVRTGRMSCSTPNMQQLSEEAKDYIIPDDGYVIVDIDFSQIEFRLIAHFIQATNIIAEYASDPNADYHKIVAKLCDIDRKPAKTMNFMLGYGGGRKKCVAVLSTIAELGDKDAIQAKANEVYDRYHRMVPTLKSTTYRASEVMRRRKYVRTLLGRRRYLPYKAHYKAFNSVVQGSAADLFKSALVRVHNYCKVEGIKLIGCVHDSFVLLIRKEEADRHIPILCNLIAEVPDGVTLRVPMRAAAKFSPINWRQCV